MLVPKSDVIYLGSTKGYKEPIETILVPKSDVIYLGNLGNL